MATDKKTHNIYLLNQDRVRTTFSLREDATNEDIIEAIMTNEEEFDYQELREDIDTKGFSVALYFRKDPVYTSKVSAFCSSFIKEGQEVLTFRPSSSSTILFIWKSDRIYVMTTGQGFRLVEDYSIPRFGLIIATLFEDALKVTSLGSNEMSSVVHSTRTVFATEVDFQSVETLDTIFKEIGARINSTQLVHDLLNLDRSSKRNSMKLKAKDSFQLGSSLDFQGLLHLLQKLDELDISHVTDRFNSITPLKAKQNATIIQAINNASIHSIFAALINDRVPSFELFHKNTDDFIRASYYRIYHGKKVFTTEEDFSTTLLLKHAFSKLLDGEEWSEEGFAAFINSSRLCSLDDEENIITDGSIISHLSGEIEVDGKTYFIIDGHYYCQSQSYVSKLNNLLQKRLRPDVYTQEIATKWNKIKSHDENWFNATVSNTEGYVQLHKMLIDNIEFADLLKRNGEELTIVHVKDGFDGEMRVLDRQVEMSLKMLIDAKDNNNDTFIRRLYRKAVEKDVHSHILVHFPSEQEFVEAIRKCGVRYIIVIRPSNKDLLKCPSNVAKFCLNELIERCYRRGIGFKIQLK